MPVVTITDAPLIINNPSFVLNPTEDHIDANGVASGAPAVQMNCTMRDLDGNANAELVDADVACDPDGKTYGQPSSDYVVEWRYTPQAYGYLKAFERSRVTFAALNNYTQPVSASNRHESGIVNFPQLPPEVHYKKNANRTHTMTLSIVGGEATSTEDPAAATFTHPLG